MKKIHIGMLFLFILASELLGNLGSIATFPNIPTWYRGLVKPPLNPPNWIFGPVWTILFALMGTSAYLVWRIGWDKPKVRRALLWFGIQFAFNILWSFLFFGARSPIAGAICIAVLWFTIIVTIRKFSAVDSIAGWLLIPYLLWVSFASYLNAGIAFLN